MKTCIIQYAWGSEYLEQLQLTQGYTSWGCSKFNYDYRCFFHTPIRHPYWEKPKLILGALEDNYSTIIWLDTDCLWLANDPLTNTHDGVIGLTWHHICPWQRSMDHYNAGMLIIHNNPNTIDLIKEWSATSDDGHPWGDQYALNKLAKKYPTLFRTLDHKYNSTIHIPDYTSDKPIIVSWHGARNRLQLMKQYIQDINK